MRIVLFIFTLGLPAFAETPKEQTAEFSGEGVVKTKADFISLTLTVRAECYGAPKDAIDATDAAVKKIDSYLQKLKNVDDKFFRVVIDGGYTGSFNRWQNNRELCRNTYQKSTNITLKMAARPGFGRVLAGIQSLVSKQFFQGISEDEYETPRIFVSISSPNPEITREHRSELEKTALDLALRDAKATFKAAIKSCTPHKWQIGAIRETSVTSYPIGPRFYAGRMQHEAMQQNSQIAPVRFDSLEIIKNLLVTFHFEGSSCYEP